MGATFCNLYYHCEQTQIPEKYMPKSSRIRLFKPAILYDDPVLALFGLNAELSQFLAEVLQLILSKINLDRYVINEIVHLFIYVRG